MRSDTHAVVTPVRTRPAMRLDDLALRGRIRAEYVEMPGLSLTIGQAARLFGAEASSCARELDALVRDGYLAYRGRVYLRAR